MSAVLQPQLCRRPMAACDVEAVLAIETRAYSHPWSRGNFTDSLAAAYVAEVWLDDEGVLFAYFVAMAGVAELHLLNVTVAPERQGRGYGLALMAAVQQHALDRGAHSLWLEVRESNQRARALYRRLGFDEVGLRRAYYPAALRREDAVVMRLFLLEAPRVAGPHALD